MTSLQPKHVDVLILCGGQGTRLKEVVADRPKSMVEIDGSPFLDRLIGHVSGYGFHRFILCIGYMSDFITEYYRKKTSNQEIMFSIEKKPMGTCGAIKNAETFIKTNPFLVMNGDSFCAVDLNGFLDFHEKKQATISMVVTEVENPDDFGSILLDDQSRVIQFAEKIKGGKRFINAGIYLFTREVLSFIPAGSQYSLEHELFPNFVNSKFYGFATDAPLLDIGTPERYEKAKQFFHR